MGERQHVRARASGAPGWTRDAKGRLVRAAEEVKPRASGLSALPVELLSHVLGYHLTDDLRRFFRLTSVSKSFAAARARAVNVECVDTNLVPYHHMMSFLRSCAHARLAPRKLRLGTLTVVGSEMALVVSWLLAKIDCSRLVDVQLSSMQTMGSHLLSPNAEAAVIDLTTFDPFDVPSFRELVSWNGPASETALEALASVKTLQRLTMGGASAAMGPLSVLVQFPELEALRISVEGDDHGYDAFSKNDVSEIIPQLGSLRALTVSEIRFSYDRPGMVLHSSSLRVVDVTSTGKQFRLYPTQCPNLREIHCNRGYYGGGPRTVLENGTIDHSVNGDGWTMRNGRDDDVLLELNAAGRTFLSSPFPHQDELPFTLPPSCTIYYHRL